MNQSKQNLVDKKAIKVGVSSGGWFWVCVRLWGNVSLSMGSQPVHQGGYGKPVCLAWRTMNSRTMQWWRLVPHRELWSTSVMRARSSHFAMQCFGFIFWNVRHLLIFPTVLVNSSFQMMHVSPMWYSYGLTKTIFNLRFCVAIIYMKYICKMKHTRYLNNILRSLKSMRP